MTTSILGRCAFAALLVLSAVARASEPTRPLFNGRYLAGWHTDIPEADNDSNISPSFIVRDGMLVSLGSPGGHLITDDILENYRLDIEYRFADEPGNCGVLVHASTPRALYGMFPASIEVQMMHGNAGDFWCIAENIAVDDMASRRAGDPASWGGGPSDSRRVLNMTDDSENPVGQWNRMVIECLDDRVRVWVNGDLVNDGYDCTATEGRIAVQAEGSEVEFRKLDLTPIRTLSPAGPWQDRPTGDAAPVRVFILAGDSGMVGTAKAAVLEHLIHEPTTADLFSHLHLDGAPVVRDDVSINFLDRRGPLAVGYGSPGCSGVELEFGHAVGDRVEEPVLIIKTAWESASLYRDFRPPSAGPAPEAPLRALLQAANEKNHAAGRSETTIEELNASVGRSYHAMLEDIRVALAELDERFPELAGRDHEIAGLVWFQGWADQYQGAEQDYESTLAHFIRDIRRDLDAPRLPVVIGVMGQNGSSPAREPMLTIQHAQLAVARRYEFAGTVAAVRTDIFVDLAAEALYPEWEEPGDEWPRHGSDQPRNYYGSPLWYSRIGRAMGDAMLRLIDAP